MSKLPSNLNVGIGQRLGSLWSLLRKAWPIWSFILTILLGIGIIQIQIIKLVIPAEDLWYLLIVIVLVWFIFTLVVLSLRSSRLERALLAAQQQVSLLEKNTGPSFLLEDIVLSSLTAHVELRRETRKINPVKLELFSLHCRVVGTEHRKDADATYYLKGVNISDSVLTGLYLSIAGDNLVPFSVLGSKLYNLHASSGRNYPLVPRLEGPDSIRKDLFLPFVNPGVEPYGTFEIELNYLWPGLFTPVKDYWFLDDIDFEGVTKRILMTMEFVDVVASSVRIYTINTSTKIPCFQGVLPFDPNNPNKFILDKSNPEKDTYYILLFESS